LKQQINPVVAAVALILVLAVAGFLVWRGSAGSTGGPGPMEKGNPGPFSPGGAAVGKAGTTPGSTAGSEGHRLPPGGVPPGAKH